MNWRGDGGLRCCQVASACSRLPGRLGQAFFSHKFTSCFCLSASDETMCSEH